METKTIRLYVAAFVKTGRDENGPYCRVTLNGKTLNGNGNDTNTRFNDVVAQVMADQELKQSILLKTGS